MNMKTASRKTKPAPRSREFSARTRLLTVADLAALPDELPSGPVLYELDNGRLVIMPPPGDIHGAVELNVGTAFKLQGEMRGLGKARSGDVGVVLWRDPDRVVGADVVFIAKKSLPLRRSKEGYLETIPDLVAEVRSKNDTIKEMLAKIADYLQAGVRLVWLIDPMKETVTAFRAGRKPTVYKKDATLTADDIIPGFQMPVTEVFRI